MTRQKYAKKRSLHVVSGHFERISNAVNLFIFPLGFANESSFDSALLIQHHALLV